ncbi:hypothetical protein [Mycobacteroides chelonae]|uniref:hypothetical protein n=1 Tax=Mycobacteroides chelonae TaxID=1774 RepID=UPI000993CF1A|nr:hypothetical protein [Mycobacteroides chelonae]
MPGAVDVGASGWPVAAVVAPGSRVGDDGEGAVAGWLGTAVAVGGVSVPPEETDAVGVADSPFGVTGLVGTGAAGSRLAGAGAVAAGADPPGVDTLGAGAGAAAGSGMDATGAGAAAGAAAGSGIDMTGAGAGAGAAAGSGMDITGAGAGAGGSGGAAHPTPGHVAIETETSTNVEVTR